MPPAHADHFAAVDGVTMPGRRPEEFPHRERRDDVTVVAHADEHSVYNGKSQRQDDRERGALARTDWISTLPRSFSMLRRTTSIPTPRPERSVTFSAVENPGAKDQGENLRPRSGLRRLSPGRVRRPLPGCGPGSGLCHRLGSG